MDLSEFIPKPPLIPALNFHTPPLLKRHMHPQRMSQHMRFMPRSLFQTLFQALLVIRHQEISVVGVGAFGNDERGAFARGETAEVGEALFGHDDVEVVFWWWM
jgi:hypothetical protein